MSTKWRIYKETFIFLWFDVNSSHVNTKTCMFPHIFSSWLYDGESGAS